MKERPLGCVNPTFWSGRGCISRNLGPLFFFDMLKTEIFNCVFPKSYSHSTLLLQGKTMISQSILLELAVGDTVQLYMCTSAAITDHKNSRYTHLVGLLLRPSVDRDVSYMMSIRNGFRAQKQTIVQTRLFSFTSTLFCLNGYHLVIESVSYSDISPRVTLSPGPKLLV